MYVVEKYLIMKSILVNKNRKTYKARPNEKSKVKGEFKLSLLFSLKLSCPLIDFLLFGPSWG